jgi:protein-L-isoaspartate(D-aspartate) O-methyltransferase
MAGGCVVSFQQDDIQRRGIGMTSQRTRERLIQRLYDEGLSNSKVLEVIRRTPRHLFVDEALSHRAYEDTALPIGNNQTISQPYMVGRMTELLLANGPLDKVLEIGTGSGYQTAVLAQLVERVFSVERIQSLQERAKEQLAELNLRNVVYRWGDGWDGWNALAPYNGIIVTAGASEVPQALLDQLAVGGRLVIPVGEGNDQQLLLIVREEHGFVRHALEGARFVPLLSGTLA